MRNIFFKLACLPLTLLLSGCNAIVLSPAGDVAAQQKDLLILSTALMLLIIIPVMVLIVVFAWRYRHTNKAATYEPEWDHSTKLELVIWSMPLLIIICLGAVTWMGTHLLDPYRPLDRLTATQPVPQSAKPLEIDVVALDWKWLFIYPEYGIATVNELAAPVGRPINFRITSSSVMNAFYVPALAGMIYAMPGMETKLHAVINHPGTFDGFSANYSGAGFSGMKFKFHSTDDAAFNEWIATVKTSATKLDRPTYIQLELPTENVTPTHYGSVDADLYAAALNLCVEPGKMCMGAMMAIDNKGGLGMEGVRNVAHLTYDKMLRRGVTPVLSPDKTFVASLCDPADMIPQVAEFQKAPTHSSPLVGHGLPQPGFSLLSQLPPIQGSAAPAPTAASPTSMPAISPSSTL